MTPLSNARDTISRVLLGIALGFVFGIVLYTASGIDDGLSSRRIVNAQIPVSNIPSSAPCGTQGQPPGPSGCCPGYPPMNGTCQAPCTGGNMSPICPSSSVPMNYDGDCATCSCTADPNGAYSDAPSCQASMVANCANCGMSSSSTPFCTTPPLTQLCGPGLCCDESDTCGMVGGFPGCVPSSSSSSGGCCNTATNSCQ